MKNWYVKNKGIKLVSGIFLLLFVVDIISTFVNGDLVQYLEANPLYPHVWLIIILNIVIAGGMYLIYTKAKTVASRYIYINTMMTICVLRAIVVWNNIKIAMDPPTIQQAMQVTQAMKTAAIVKIGYMGFIPYLIGYLTYLVFALDHKIEKKEE